MLLKKLSESEVCVDSRSNQFEEMFGGRVYLIALTFLVLQLATKNTTNGQNLPKEIEQGPEGNIIINLGGIPDSRQLPSHALLRLRAKSRGVATHNMEANVETSSTIDVGEKVGRKEKATDYDYDAYMTKPAQKKNEGGGKRTQKPKKAKSKRPTLLQWLSELVGGEKNGGKRTLSAGETFGAANALQLFDNEDESGQRQPLSTLLISANNQRPSNVDLHSHSASKNNAVSMGRTLLKKISQERMSINEGCRSWSDFHRLTAQLTARRPNIVDGRVQRPIESTSPLINSESQSSSLAIFSPANNSFANTQLPLPECFLNQLGMVCCNRVLEDLIFRANDAMINANVNTCNIEIFSELLKNIAEKQFQTTFEIIVANGDFASKVRFKDNLLCKTITNNKFVLIYATPEPYTLSPYNVQPPLIA